jgi:hypothetical protein
MPTVRDATATVSIDTGLQSIPYVSVLVVHVKGQSSMLRVSPRKLVSVHFRSPPESTPKTISSWRPFSRPSGTRAGRTGAGSRHRSRGCSGKFFKDALSSSLPSFPFVQVLWAK